MNIQVFVAAVLSAAVLCAQRPASPLPAASPPAVPRAQDQQLPDGTLPAGVPLPRDLLMPLHTHAPAAGEPDYGWWAAGPSWKASFHDGFAFYPYRGPDRELVRFHWRTESITVGGEPLALDVLETSQAADRWETRYQDVTEVYELRPEGVEQLFVLPRRPDAAGDLVVTGRIDGDLACEDRGPTHGPLAFQDRGEDAVRYGRALALDAAGQSIEIATSAEGGRVRLHVPAAFVAAAQFPLTIDPLVGTAAVVTFAGSSPTVDLAVETSTTLNQLVVAYVLQFASNDTDAFAVIGPTDYSGLTFWWSDMSTSYGTPELDIAWCAGERSYVIAYSREYALGAGTYSVPYVYIQKDNQLVLNAGTTAMVSSGVPGVRWRGPTIGGGYGSCNKALAAWELDFAGQSSVRYTIVDVTNQTAGGLILDPDPQTNQDESLEPDVMPMSKDGLPWRLVWRSTIGALHEIRTLLVTQTGATIGFSWHDSGTSPLGSPQVAGAYDDSDQLRVVLAWHRNSQFIRQIRSYDLSPSGAVRSIATGTTVRVLDLRADHVTGSNFLLSYSSIIGLTRNVYLARLGGSGARIDTEAVGAFGAVAMCFESGAAPDFLFVYDDSMPVAAIRGTRFDYPPDAETVLIGGGCSSSGISAPYPFAGNRNFAVRVSNVPVLTPVVLAIGTAPTNVPLTPLGIPCPLYVSPTGVVTLAAFGFGGEVLFPIPLPDAPPFTGDLYLQALLPFGSSPSATSGLRAQVR